MSKGFPMYKELKELRKCLKLWETEKATNEHGLQKYADRAIIVLKRDIEILQKSGKMR